MESMVRFCGIHEKMYGIHGTEAFHGEVEWNPHGMWGHSKVLLRCHKHQNSLYKKVWFFMLYFSMLMYFVVCVQNYVTYACGCSKNSIFNQCDTHRGSNIKCRSKNINRHCQINLGTYCCIHLVNPDVGFTCSDLEILVMKVLVMKILVMKCMMMNGLVLKGLVMKSDHLLFLCFMDFISHCTWFFPTPYFLACM